MEIKINKPAPTPTTVTVTFTMEELSEVVEVMGRASAGYDVYAALHDVYQEAGGK